MKIAIITIDDDNNYGNRLQNYALEQFIQKKGTSVTTIRLSQKKYDIKRIIKIMINYKKQWKIEKRYKKFKQFNKYINIEKITSINKDIIKKYDYFIVGSDQVWNPNFNHLTDKELLTDIPSEKRISYAASFGINELPKEYHRKTKQELNKFKAISVREDKGKEIIENLTNRNDIEVSIDPTMLLTSQEWEKIIKKPKQLKKNKFILNYFLGELSVEKKKKIEKIAKENDCEIINILDKKSPYYTCGPSEFLYLEKNAFLICTDSFHSSVFAIIFNRPFIIFDRVQKDMKNMNSRLETLINKFKLKHRNFENEISQENLNHNYSEAFKILENERKKSQQFLDKAIINKEGE